MKKRLGVFLFIFWHAHTMQPHEIFIIVPGTWALKEPWYKIGGNFFNALQEAVAYNGAKVLWFRWLTDNSESCRREAAREFAHILSCFEQNTTINVVAHSHGVNVALAACQMLAKLNPERTIKTLYALGAPVHEHTYPADMHVIKNLYNLYSLNDTVQTIFAGFYKRVFAPQQGIVNMRTSVDGKEPTHTDMHSPTIGKWLAALPHILCTNPSTVKFFDHQPPEVGYDELCEKLLAQEKPIDFETLLHIRNTKKK